MKKLFLLIIVSLVCVSCYDRKTHENDALETYTAVVPYVYTKQISLNVKSYTYGQISSINHFTYNNHDYIQFHVAGGYRVVGGYGGGDAIVHDPDCKCMKNEK